MGYSTMDLAMLVIVMIVICIAARFRIDERTTRKKITNGRTHKNDVTVSELS